MPVPYPPPNRLPVVMCAIPGCPYRRHATRDGSPVCQQHTKMIDHNGAPDRPLNLGSVELRYTPDGFPVSS